MPKNTYLRKFLENLDDIAFVIDYEHMVYKYISPSIRNRGITPAEVYADPSILFKMMDPDYRQDLLRQIRDNIDKGPLHFEYPLSLPNGEVKWYSSHLFLASNEGEGMMFAGIIREVTEQKRTELELEQLKQEYEDLYNHAPVGYHSLDPNGVLLRINDTELSWLGYKREELVGKQIAPMLCTPESLREFREVFKALQAGGIVKDQYVELVRKDGSLLLGLVNATPVMDQDGKMVMTRSTITDIGNLKSVEEKLRLKQLELEATNEALRETNQKLERLNFTKDVLLKIVSHDLRNPLLTIKMISELLNERYDQIDTETVHSYLSYINEASRQASHILNDLSGMISLENDDIFFNFEQTDLATVIEEAIGINARKAKEKGIRLYYEERHTIQSLKAKVDAKWMVRALDNIIANAIKFSNKGDEVKIACHQHSEKVVLSIADTGIGIPKAMLPKLFEKHAVPSRPGTAGETGTGLGLSIVKQILDMQVGEISVKSREGVGSTFEIKLPMAAN